ncbi:adenosine deaminase family protein [Actinomadura madurae]|uniref:adenosine deaminase family protein n=1 Tax=Actinomadura madurae TaxID=1993 RepID=UPI00399BE247
MRSLADLPKAHLHLHIGMGMRPSTFAELGAKAGLPTELPPLEQMTLESFESVSRTLTAILSERDNWHRFFDELLADHSAEGVVYVEPSLPLRVYSGSWPSDEHLLAAVVEIAEEYSAQHGVGVGFMIPIDRTNDSPGRAVELAELAARNRGQGVVSLGLHGDEAGQSADIFTTAFSIARDAGLLVTPHAGEGAGAESVEVTLDCARPQRIQHGVRSIESERTVTRLVREQVCLDVCPTSNKVLGVTPDLTAHPLPELVRASVPCSVNADDPLVFRTSVLQEYAICRSVFDIDDEGLAWIARSSITYSGASEEIKQRGLAGVDAWLASV